MLYNLLIFQDQIGDILFVDHQLVGILSELSMALNAPVIYQRVENISLSHGCLYDKENGPFPIIKKHFV